MWVYWLDSSYGTVFFKDLKCVKVCRENNYTKVFKRFLSLYWKHDLHFLSGFTSHLLACTWVRGQLESHLHTLGLAHLECGQPLLWWYSQTRKTEGQCEGQWLREKCNHIHEEETTGNGKCFIRQICLFGRKDSFFYFCVLTRGMWSQEDDNQQSNFSTKHFWVNVPNSTL